MDCSFLTVFALKEETISETSKSVSSWLTETSSFRVETGLFSFVSMDDCVGCFLATRSDVFLSVLVENLLVCLTGETKRLPLRFVLVLNVFKLTAIEGFVAVDVLEILSVCSALYFLTFE